MYLHLLYKCVLFWLVMGNLLVIAIYTIIYTLENQI